ncbi:hypothetical protein F4824DRAFT_452938 [Ustulina deusta]|nr:hypothetical protein F4824DRAFT_452938 [Ustulina deusta]
MEQHVAMPLSGIFVCRTGAAAASWNLPRSISTPETHRPNHGMQLRRDNSQHPPPPLGCSQLMKFRPFPIRIA